MMLGLFGKRDPWWEDGQGARRDRSRRRIVETVAFAAAIAACGLTTAAWLRTILPLLGVSPFA